MKARIVVVGGSFSPRPSERRSRSGIASLVTSAPPRLRPVSRLPGRSRPPKRSSASPSPDGSRRYRSGRETRSKRGASSHGSTGAKCLPGETKRCRASIPPAPSCRELERGSRTEEVAQARAARDAAANRLEDALRDLERSRTLQQGGAIPKEALDKAELAVELARKELERAEEQLRLLEAGPRRERIDAQRAALAQVEASLRAIDAALDFMTLEAPFDGVITVRHREPGEAVSPGAAVLTLMNPERPLGAHLHTRRSHRSRPGGRFGRDPLRHVSATRPTRGRFVSSLPRPSSLPRTCRPPRSGCGWSMPSRCGSPPIRRAT